MARFTFHMELYLHEKINKHTSKRAQNLSLKQTISVVINGGGLLSEDKKIFLDRKNMRLFGPKYIADRVVDCNNAEFFGGCKGKDQEYMLYLLRY